MGQGGEWVDEVDAVDADLVGELSCLARGTGWSWAGWVRGGLTG